MARLAALKDLETTLRPPAAAAAPCTPSVRLQTPAPITPEKQHEVGGEEAAGAAAARTPDVTEPSMSQCHLGLGQPESAALEKAKDAVAVGNSDPPKANLMDMTYDFFISAAKAGHTLTYSKFMGYMDSMIWEAINNWNEIGIIGIENAGVRWVKGMEGQVFHVGWEDSDGSESGEEESVDSERTEAEDSG